MDEDYSPTIDKLIQHKKDYSHLLTWYQELVISRADELLSDLRRSREESKLVMSKEIIWFNEPGFPECYANTVELVDDLVDELVDQTYIVDHLVDHKYPQHPVDQTYIVDQYASIVGFVILYHPNSDVQIINLDHVEYNLTHSNPSMYKRRIDLVSVMYTSLSHTTANTNQIGKPNMWEYYKYHIT